MGTGRRRPGGSILAPKVSLEGGGGGGGGGSIFNWVPQSSMARCI